MRRVINIESNNYRYGSIPIDVDSCLLNPYVPTGLGLDIPVELLIDLKHWIKWFLVGVGMGSDTLVVPYLAQLIQVIGREGMRDLKVLRRECANKEKYWKDSSKICVEKVVEFWTRTCSAIDTVVYCNFRILPFKLQQFEDDTELILHVPVSTNDQHFQRNVLPLIRSRNKEKNTVCLMLVGGAIVIKHRPPISSGETDIELDSFGPEGRFLLQLLSVV